ncbi:MAG: PEP-CTERM sorting domain-containing protein [Myxococcota bacterium]|nr:PEP-CTERM sorting domain-containing protein [Myxococcales bacterium]
MRMRLSMLSVLFAFSVASPALAVSTFHSSASFLGALSTYVVEDFEDEALVGTPNSGGVSSLVLSDFTVTSSKPALKILGAPAFGNHNTTPGGSQYLSADTDLGFVAASVGVSAFPGPVNAVGFELIDFDLMPAVVTVNGHSYWVKPTGDGGSRFFGVIADAPITSLRIGPLGLDSHWSIDDLVLGSTRRLMPAVPEPSAALVFGIGSVFAATATRRRRIARA